MFLSRSNLGLCFVGLGPVSLGVVRLCNCPCLGFSFGLGWAKTDSGHFRLFFNFNSFS